MQEGYDGMLKAAEKFDFAKDTQFSTYASWFKIAVLYQLQAFNRSFREAEQFPRRHIFKNGSCNKEMYSSIFAPFLVFGIALSFLMTVFLNFKTSHKKT